MKPRKSAVENEQQELFRMELAELLDPGHGLVKLAASVDWAAMDAAFGTLFCAGNGRPAIPTRLMVALHYLKYMHDLSDEAVLAGWLENPYWQHLCGMKWFQHTLPIDSSSMTRWRNRIGEVGAQALLEETVKTGLRLKAIKPTQLQRVNIDTTVQEKTVRYPTDARLYDRARAKLVAAAKRVGVKLRQNYNRVSKFALLMQGRYAHARQMKRAKRQTRQLKTYLGRVMRDIQRKCPNPDAELRQLLEIAGRIFQQQPHDKNKVYSVHEPHVECICKGKAHKKYEFGCKVSVAVTSRGGWFVAAQALHGNPYDGHTLARTLEQVAKTAVLPKLVFVDRGYRGHDYTGPVEVHVDKERRGKTPKSLWRWMKRRAAVEPSIGHLKQDHRLDRNRLKGASGDCINATLSAAGMNFRKLFRWLALFLPSLFACLVAIFRKLFQKNPPHLRTFFFAPG